MRGKTLRYHAVFGSKHIDFRFIYSDHKVIGIHFHSLFQIVNVDLVVSKSHAFNQDQNYEYSETSGRISWYHIINIFGRDLQKQKVKKAWGGGVRPEFVYRLQKGKVFVYNCIKLQSAECTKCIPMTGNIPIPYQYCYMGNLLGNSLKVGTNENGPACGRWLSIGI
jgi:hypothetical protein